MHVNKSAAKNVILYYTIVQQTQSCMCKTLTKLAPTWPKYKIKQSTSHKSSLINKNVEPFHAIVTTNTRVTKHHKENKKGEERIEKGEKKKDE
jgi:replication initiation and membrane attachment protein DnaB